ncbi:helix-turn-helix domain-containing protein [Neptunicoccus cionae]|uniref:4-hydroxy-3-methylbut-2-en-1-yl diphosphate synthase n=1 Tax=Neptunicoccus cionae TaxID=2035344 RepID=A0A916QZ14_9RHOB|nr:helix-turn-helix domain-containing protein [Amylibacter cionae]GGA24823.1 4-hydroxy-3-methylbut-2-en-1-yl diphosphate synthase [Amylibacter cionae]
MDKGFGKQQPRGFDTFEVTLGDQMRGERATLGKSLLDVQRDLRIKATYISAIENCDPSVFQTQGFIAGYVRSYARYLEMDPDECFVRFCEESGFSGVHSELKPNSLANKSAALLHTPVRPATADPIARPRIPMTPQSAGFLSNISPSALGSVLVLALLVGGLGYGSWAVLQEVQRVQFVPVNQTPGVTSEVATLPIEPTSQRDNVVALNPTSDFQTSNLDQLYRPTELEVPQMVARDAPISSFNAGSLGAYADLQIHNVHPPVVEQVEEVAPRVVAEGPPPVDVVALKPAWIRVYFDDGSVLFEKILDAGERYRIPSDVDGAKLRAGNAGAVFVMVGDNTYGPVGNRGGVVRDVALGKDNVSETMALATDLFTTPLAPPLNGMNPVADASGSN